MFPHRADDSKTPQIDKKAIIKDVYLEVTMTIGYFSTLMVANLIALSGLITNSAPVIIGAMLISPLMSPILSIGFAVTTADNVILGKSVKKIALSVAAVIAIAAIATYVSPLKDVTNEIAARTRPNLYDLIIAFLSGSAGAAALCSRKNYLTIVPGVAIATAVIPPLSVVGFGIGIGDATIALGGFFLFFVNFVAIIISTSLVLYAYGFRPSVTGGASSSKRRMVLLFTTLFVISMPLLYTLQKTVSEIRLKNSIQSALDQAFNKERLSHLQTFSYTADRSGRLQIDALVNTVGYIKESQMNEIESRIKTYLKRDIRLYVEQMKVQPGGLKEVRKQESVAPVIVPVRPPQEIISTARQNTIAVMRQATGKIGEMIAPSKIENFRVSFQDKSLAVSMSLNVKRDIPFSEEETLWLTRIVAKEINVPVELHIETEPFVPPLQFSRGEIALSDEMKSTILGIKDVYNRDTSLKVRIEAFPEAIRNRRERRRLSEERIRQVREIVMTDTKVPADKIITVIHKRAMKTLW